MNLHRGTSTVALTTSWFAVCSGLSWVAAGYLYPPPLAPLAAFVVAGCFAGVSLRAGYGVVLGSGLAFAIGNVGSFIPVMATQAMSGDASFFDVGMACVLSQVVAWGTGAAIGLSGLYRSASRVYVWGVVGFVIGGFVGGLLLTIVIVSGHMPVFALLSPLIIAPSIGGGTVAHRLRGAESSAV